MKQALDNLKERPKDEKTAVAGGVAVVIMIVLFIGWGFYFFKKIAAGGEVNTPFGVREDVVKGATIDRAAIDFLDSYNASVDEFRAIRDQAAQDQYANTYDNERGLDNFDSSFVAPQEAEPGFGF